MYCPKCGESNSDETRFCRSCGENLKVISQVMTRRLPVALASKLDAYIERKNERLRRDGIGSAVIGICFALLGGYELINGAVIFRKRRDYAVIRVFHVSCQCLGYDGV